MPTLHTAERLAARARPDGIPVMHQTWENLLFLHWPMDPDLIRPHIPPSLELDLYDGRAWIGVTPYFVSGMHLTALPPIPGLDSFVELNVRTYVRFQDTPGVWFFSLDASKVIPAVAARLLYGLPYCKADMTFRAGDSNLVFSSRRLDSSGAQFDVRWRTGITLRDPDSESLAFFLVERYSLFSGSDERLRTTRVYHHPWILEEAFVDSYASTVMSAAGFPEPLNQPLAHFSRSMNVEVWPPAPV